RTSPPFWTTYRLPVLSPACVTWMGDDRPPITASRRTLKSDVGVRVAVPSGVGVRVAVAGGVAVAVGERVAVDERVAVGVGVAVRNAAGPPPTKVGHSPQASTTTSGT